MLMHSILIILVIILTTYFTRIWPFMVFNAKNPPNDFVRYLGSGFIMLSDRHARDLLF